MGESYIKLTLKQIRGEEHRSLDASRGNNIFKPVLLADLKLPFQ